VRSILFFCSLHVSITLLAHTEHHHGKHSNTAQAEEPAADLKKVYADINKEYFLSVKPVFDKKCAACHSVDVAAPWYTSIPIVHWIVESDRSEAKEHLEISKGFPFAGHGTPEEDLKAIREVASKGTMPTWLYSFMHPGSKLTEEDKAKVLNWVDTSEKKVTAVVTSPKQ